MIVGTVVFAAVRPTTRPMCPASQAQLVLVRRADQVDQRRRSPRRDDVVALGPHGQERHA